MSVVATGAGTSGFGDPATITLGASLSSGQTLVLGFVPTGGQTVSGVTVGGNAATQDLNNTDYYLYRYYSASGGESSVSIDLSASGLCLYWYVVDDEIDNADPVDNTVAYGASGEGFATAHQYDITAGVPAAGGLAVCAARCSGRTWAGASGSSVIADTGDVDIAGVYKADIAAGAVALNHTFTAAGNSDGMVITYNYAGGGGAQNVLAWIRA